MRNPNALTDDEEQWIKLARSMYSSAITNTLRDMDLDDLGVGQLRKLAAICIVRARRMDPADTAASTRKDPS